VDDKLKGRVSAWDMDFSRLKVAPTGEILELCSGSSRKCAATRSRAREGKEILGLCSGSRKKPTGEASDLFLLYSPAPGNGHRSPGYEGCIFGGQKGDHSGHLFCFTNPAEGGFGDDHLLVLVGHEFFDCWRPGQAG